MTSYTETDPVYSVSAASGITGANITSWNTASSGSFNSVDITELIQLSDVDRTMLTPSAGAICFDDNELWFYNGTAWVQISHTP